MIRLDNDTRVWFHGRALGDDAIRWYEYSQLARLNDRDALYS